MTSELVWYPDNEASFCSLCSSVFGFFKRKHHCRKCGKICCNNCTQFRMKVPEHGFTSRVRVCTKCCYDSMQAPKFPGSFDNDPVLTSQQDEDDGDHDYQFNSLRYPISSRQSQAPSQRSQSFASLSRVRHSLPPSNSAPLHQAPRTRPPASSAFPSPPSLVNIPQEPASQFAVPPNWPDLEPMHFGPLLTFPIQFQIPITSKVVELPDSSILQRGLQGFFLKPPKSNPIPLRITTPYVPANNLTAHGGVYAAIVKTGPALCMLPDRQNWARGMLCVDGARVTWQGRQGEMFTFSLSPNAVLAPVDRGGQIRGVASKADGILGIADGSKRAEDDENDLKSRNIWYFHYPSKEARNMWRFSITFNIAHLLSGNEQFEKVRLEFVRACVAHGVRGAEGLNWKEILDVIYGDD